MHISLKAIWAKLRGKKRDAKAIPGRTATTPIVEEAQSVSPRAEKTNAQTADDRTRDQQRPDGDDEHVWNDMLVWVAEAKSHAVLAAGVQHKGRRDDTARYREMVWEQRNGRWWGRWRWTEWEDPEVWEKRATDRWEHAVRAWDVANAPQEVLLWVIECLVGRHLSFARDVEEAAAADEYLEPVKGLGNLALVCRVWYNLIAPALYCRLEVTDKGLRFPLRQSHAQHARQITVRGNRPSISSTKAARLGARPSPAVRLGWEGPEREEDQEAPYHPSHAIICAQVHRSYSNIICLELSCCAFLSSADLLRLLASFSALITVDLRAVTVHHISDSIIRSGHPSVGLLQRIRVAVDCKPPGLSFISHSWAWPRGSSHRQPSAFHGLLSTERRLVSRACGVLSESGPQASYCLDAMDGDNETWVASMLIKHVLHVEFHAKQDTLESGAAIVHHCLFRVQYDSDVPALTERLKTLSDTFPKFLSLETVVLETSVMLGPSDIRSVAKALRKVFRVEVQHRTCEEAHNGALEAKKGLSFSSGAGLLSPFWCLEQHARNDWDSNKFNFWLSKEYWADLEDEDKEGWDPSRPAATPPTVNV